MSKSTPLSSLPNLQENQAQQSNSSAYNENENQLVNEILQEIEGKQQDAPPQAPPEAPPQMPMPPPQMEQPNQMIAPPVSQEEMMNRAMQQQALRMQQAQMQQAQMEQVEEEDLSFQERMIRMLKLPAVVALICMVLSLPQVSNALAGVLNSKPSLAKYATYLVPLLKGLIAAGLYFGATQAL